MTMINFARHDFFEKRNKFLAILEMAKRRGQVDDLKMERDELLDELEEFREKRAKRKRCCEGNNDQWKTKILTFGSFGIFRLLR